MGFPYREKLEYLRRKKVAVQLMQTSDSLYFVSRFMFRAVFQEFNEFNGMARAELALHHKMVSTV